MDSDPIQIATNAPAFGQPVPRVSAHLLWMLRLLCLIAVAVSLYLLYQSLLHRNEPLGCGPDSNCEQVLSSRWSRWFSIPVSAPAAGIYVALLLASLGVGPSCEPVIQRASWRTLAVLATTSLGAGLWFLAIQHFVLHAFCPWCLSVHICAALILALLVIARRQLAPRVHGRSTGSGSRRIWPWAIGAVLPLALLIIGQVDGKPVVPANHVTAAEGKLNVSSADFPVIGKADAPHVLITMGDYCCQHCRRTHRVLQRTRTRYGSQLAIIALPVPMNSTCNPLIGTTAPDSVNACELARIALAVWRAKPAAFAQIDDWLFDGDAPPTPQAAREFAAKLVGDSALRTALADPVTNAALHHAVQAYSSLGGGMVPKVILPNSVLSGEIHDESALYQLIEREMHIEPGI